jgi:hypothetical protein
MKYEIIKSYLNEIELDRSAIPLINDIYGNYYCKYLFKILKVSMLSKVKYFSFRSFVIFYIYTFPLSLATYVGIQYVRTLFKKNKVLSSTNVGLVIGHKSVINFDKINIKDVKNINVRNGEINNFLTRKENYYAFISSLSAIFQCIKKTASYDKVVYASLKLHMNDVFAVASLITFVRKYDKRGFCLLMDNHYDRWAYIVSTTIKNSNSYLIQHGYLNPNIPLPNKLGRIDRLYVYDHSFALMFNKYYREIVNTRLIYPDIKLSSLPNDKVSVLVISSLPFVSYELDIIKKALICKSIRLYLKTHPGYEYRDMFNEFSDHIDFIEKNDFPNADILITYNSFLGYEYQLMNKNVFWIQEYKNKLEDLYLLIQNEVDSLKFGLISKESNNK